MEIVFIIKTTFNNSICIISCNWSSKVIRLPTLRVFCIAHTPWALTGRKSCWQRYLLTICYTTSYHRTTRIAFTPGTGLALAYVPIRYLEKGRIWWASNCYSTGDRLAFPGATATCPTGKRVTGGGGICTSRTGYIWLTRSFPSANNSWSAACDTTEDQNGSITVYAICQ